jgi:glycosyltransferase involved in cell wall biosynthesis
MSAALDRVDVSVLVPVRNEESCVRDTVASMRAQRFEGRIEFLLVDGRSEDRTRAILDEIAAEDERITVLDNPARTTPSALNIGLRNARGEFVARMDAHAYYSPDYVSKGVERLRLGGVDWVSGPAIPGGQGRWSRLVSRALESPIGAGGSRKWRDAAEFMADTGVFAGVWRRSTLERLGGWDEGWPANQDSELAARVLAAGGRIVSLPELAATYLPRDSLAALARQYLRYGFYRAKTARAHPNSIRRSHLLPPALALTVLAAAVGPRRLRRAAEAGLAVYGVSVLGASLHALRRGQKGDVLRLTAVFMTMHLAFGAGFLAGGARFGPPLAAIARLARR